MTKQQNGNIDLELVETCLYRFIQEHKNEATLRQLLLDAGSLKGRKVRERDDLWFLGDWVIQGNPSSFEASWNHDIAPGESERLIVHLKKKGDEYVVIDWTVEQSF